MFDRDIDIPTGSELLAEAGLPAHAIRNILGENQGRIQHRPGRPTPLQRESLASISAQAVEPTEWRGSEAWRR